jgi:deoxycytidine triphosphate deaminase
VAQFALEPDLVEDLVTSPADRSDSQIQPASIDLRIGQIFVPGTEPGKSGSASAPLTARRCLMTGQTAVVTTHERCNFPDCIGAIGFPRSEVSAEGLLMTNPGHVDPGYKGALTFTVINMGRKPYELKQGARIVTLLLFKLDPPSASDYALRNPSVGQSGGLVNQELLDQLSADFLDVDVRAERAAQDAERRTRRLTIMAGVLPGVAAILLAWSPWSSGQTSKFDQFDKRVSVLEAGQSVGTLRGQLTLLQREVQTLKLDLHNDRRHHHHHDE